MSSKRKAKLPPSAVPIEATQREIRVEIMLVVAPSGRVSTALRISSHRTDATDETTRRVQLMQPIASERMEALAHALGTAVCGEEMVVVASTTTEPNRPEPFLKLDSRGGHA